MRTFRVKGGFFVPALWIASTALVFRIAHIVLSEKFDPLAGDLVLDSKTYVHWAEALLSRSTPPTTSLMQAPLYPWFTALIYKITGPGIINIKLLQALIGTISCVLTASLASRVFKSRCAGLLTGLTLAVYKPLIFYCGVLVPATLLIFLLSLSTWIIYQNGIPDEGEKRVAASKTASTVKDTLIPLAAGATLGLAVIAKPTALMLAPFGLLHLHISNKQRRRNDAGRAAWRKMFNDGILLYLLGLVLALSPLPITNYKLSGEFIPLTTGGGINFYIGHNPAANGFYSVPTFEGKPLGATPDEQWRNMHRIASAKAGIVLKPSEVSAFWFSEGLRFMKEHPRSELSLLWNKLLFFMNDYERANIENIYFHARFPGVLMLPLPGFGILAPLALAGIFLTLRKWKSLLPLYGGIAVYLSSSLIFYVLARYRLPVVIFMAPFAGAFIVETVGVIRKRRLTTMLLLVAALAALLYLSNIEIARDTTSTISNNLVRLGKVYVRSGRFDKALEAFREALRTDPSNRAAREGIRIILQNGKRE